MRQVVLILCAQPEVSAVGDSEVWRQDWDLTLSRKTVAYCRKRITEENLCTTQTKSHSWQNIKTHAHKKNNYEKQGQMYCTIMPHKLVIMAELYSCRKTIQRRFHFHAGLYPSNTFQKEQFVCYRGLLNTARKLCKHWF